MSGRLKAHVAALLPFVEKLRELKLFRQGFKQTVDNFCKDAQTVATASKTRTMAKHIKF